MSQTLSPRSTWRILADPALVLIAIGALGCLLRSEPARATRPPPASPVAATADEPEPEPPPPAPIAAPVLDVAAVTRAQQALDSAIQYHALASRRETEAEQKLDRARTDEARAAEEVAAIQDRLRVPAARFDQFRAQGAVLRTEQDKLRSELTSLADAPRPRRKPLIDKTPVARPAQGEEFHFEVRRDRVAYIDVDRLVDRVKADAQVQLRLAAGNPSSLVKPMASSVGPIGAFAMRYEMGRSLPSSMSDVLGARGVSFSLLGWEIVPVRDVRGETLAMMQQPASDLYRVLHSLNPSHATVTLWVYPDGFALYRKLNDYLHERGFQVAARPLPAGMPIRGSPAGSLSAGQ